MDYLLEALRRRELFAWLRLEPRAAWHALLFRDRFNWQGLSAPLAPALRTQLASQPGALSQVSVILQVQTTIKSLLPTVSATQAANAPTATCFAQCCLCQCL